MLEAAKHSKDTLEAVIAKIIVENSPILEAIPFKTISGPAFRYHRETMLGSISFRGVGGSYTPDAGLINPLFEPLVIMGGEVKIDNFEVNVMGNLMDIKAAKYKMKARQAAFTFSQAFFEGDTAIDPYSFDGLRKRLAGSQKILFATGGGKISTTPATILFPKLDLLMDSVAGEPGDKVLYMNDSCRRALTAAVRAQTGSTQIQLTQDLFGRQQVAYAGTPIRLVRREDDGTSIFGYDEDPGDGASDTCSMYCVRYGTDYVHGIQNAPLPSVKDFGEVQAGPYHLGRIEWYPGLVVKHPRAAARLYGILAE
jgi:hypothetical protein